jgi:hypothetical protein
LTAKPLFEGFDRACGISSPYSPAALISYPIEVKRVIQNPKFYIKLILTIILILVKTAPVFNNDNDFQNLNLLTTGG